LVRISTIYALVVGPTTPLIKGLPSISAGGGGLGPFAQAYLGINSNRYIIQHDLMMVFDSFWRRTEEAFNQAVMILLAKQQEASCLKNFRPISLIHIVGKLISMVLANQLLLFHPTTPTLLSHLLSFISQ
jgi:hypothetical protein